MRTNPSESLDQVDEAIVKATRDLGYYTWLGASAKLDCVRIAARFVERELDEMLMVLHKVKEER
jgi:hypothetical protein